MFKKMLGGVAGIFGEQWVFDPASLNDEVALRTEWGPVKRGGASFKTHELVMAGPNRLEFKASMGALAFYVLFVLVGTGVVFGVLVSQARAGTLSWTPKTLGPVAIGLIFEAAGLFMLVRGLRKIVFDSSLGYFWKGRKTPAEGFNIDQPTCCCKLGEIYAVQLIRELCRSGGKNRSTYYSYELNLVLADGGRINVVDHGGREKILDQGRQIADFLNRPLWDAS